MVKYSLKINADGNENEKVSEYIANFTRKISMKFPELKNCSFKVDGEEHSGFE